MNNLMQQSRAAGYAKPATREGNNEVHDRLVSGDASARDEMIEGNMAVAILRVDSVLHRAPHLGHLRDDLIGAALLALCEAVDTMQETGPVEDANPNGYISTAIDKALAKLVSEDNTIVVPQRTQEVARKDEKEIRPPHVIGGNTALTLAGRLHALDRTAVIDLAEEIQACCRDGIDRQIVAMREEGSTDSEIAEAVGLAERSVSLRRKKMFERLKERCPEYAR